MPLINTGLEFFGYGLQQFYSQKTVLQTWRFAVELLTDVVPSKQPLDEDILAAQNAVRYISYQHIVDVSLPLYKFSIVDTMYGAVPKTFPKLDHRGFNIAVTYEEDRNGNVMSLIHHLQKTIISETGVYKRLNQNKLGNLVVTLFNENGTKVCRWIAKEVYYLGANDVSLSYKSDDTLKYTINFGCDIIKFLDNRGMLFDERNALSNYRSKLYNI